MRTTPPPSGPRLGTALLLIGTWWFLLRIQTPGLSADDSGETVASALGLGVSHPPGYPLLNLLGRLALLFPVGSPAFRMNLLSSLFLLGSVALLLAACRCWIGRGNDTTGWPHRAALGIAALSILSHQDILAQSLSAKGGVYTLALLATTGLLWLSLRGDPPRRAETAFFLWAVAMGGHWQSLVFAIPLLAFLAVRTGLRWDAKRILLALSFLLVGFSLYLYLPLRAALQPAVNWEDPVRFDAFWRSVSRVSYAAREWLEPHRATDSLRHASAVLQSALLHAWPGFVLLALTGWAAGLRRRAFQAVCLLTAGLAPALVIILFLNIPADTPFYAGIYLVPFQSITALLGFAGLSFLLSDREGRPRPGSPWIAAFLGIAVLAWTAHAFDAQDRRHDLRAADYGMNLLKELPPGALLVTRGDQNLMPALYARHALGKRPDTAVIPLFLFESDWGFRQALRQAGETQALPDPGEARARFRRLAERALGARRPLRYAEHLTRLEDARIREAPFALAPRGLTLALLELPEDPSLTARETRRIAASWRRPGGASRNLRPRWRERLAPPTGLPDSLFLSYYSDPLLLAGRLLLREGREREGLAAIHAARVRSPRGSEVLLFMAKWALDRKDYELAIAFAQETLKKEEIGKVEAWEVLGTAQLLAGDNAGAVKSLREARRLSPGSKVAGDNLPVALKAEAWNRPLLPRKAPPPEYHLRMAEWFEKDGCPLFAETARRAARIPEAGR